MTEQGTGLPSNRSTVVGREAAVSLGGDNLVKQLDGLGVLDPALSRMILAGLAGAGGLTDARESALQILAVLVAIGDAPAQIEVYRNAASQHGATDDEILDVINTAAAYVGFPRAVNGARAMAAYLRSTRSQRLPGAEESVVQVGDHETLIWDNGGEGPAMLLIHALCMDRRFWRDVYATLAPLGRVVAYDVRGHGMARGAPLTQDLDQLADDAKLLMDALGIDQADVYGSSYGGAIAQYLAVDHPARVRSLGLLATSVVGDLQELGGRADAAEENGMEAQVAKSIIRWFLPETIAVNPWCVRYARQRVRTARVEEWAAAWRAMARLDVAEKAKAFGQPTLILSGTKDLSSTPEVMKYMLPSYQNSKFVSIENGTHFMPMEQPRPVAQALVGFRREVEGTA